MGIDEIAYRTGHRYLTVVINHDTGLIVWAKEGRDSAVLGEFFDELGAERVARIEKVSADGAEWIWSAVTARAPHAIQCLDLFHLIGWAGTMVDKVRRRTVATHGGGTGAMWAVRTSRGCQMVCVSPVLIRERKIYEHGVRRQAAGPRRSSVA